MQSILDYLPEVALNPYHARVTWLRDHATTDKKSYLLLVCARLDAVVTWLDKIPLRSDKVVAQCGNSRQK